MQVVGYFEGTSGYSSSLGVNALVSAVAGAFGGFNGGTETQQTIYNSFDEAFGIIGVQGTSDDTRPAAYLNYILFDENMQFYSHHGHTQISNAANTKQVLSLSTGVIQKPGFIYVYLSYESAGTHPVFFDDLNVVLKEHPVIQADDYYPFGLTFNSYQRAGAKKNKYLFGGKEIQNDLDLGWLDFHARQYDPALGRMLSIDPLAEMTHDWTPYRFGFNNPVRFTDPTGMTENDATVQDVVDQLMKGLGDGGRAWLSNSSSQDDCKGDDCDEEKEKSNEKSDKTINFGPWAMVADATYEVGMELKTLAQVSVIPVYNEAGEIIAYFKTYNKITFKALKIVNGTIQVAGKLVTGADVVSNTYQVATGKISGERYSYRMIGTGASLYAASAAGGPVGILVGGVFIAGELSFDSIQKQNQHYEKLRDLDLIDHRNKASSWDDFVNDVFFWMRR